MDKKVLNALATTVAAVELPEGVTPDTIQAWKNKYGQDQVKLISIPRDDNHSEYLDVVARVPSRLTLSEYEKLADQNPDKAKNILVTNCLLTGLEVVKADDALFFSAVACLAELIPIRKAIIKNL